MDKPPPVKGSRSYESSATEIHQVEEEEEAKEYEGRLKELKDGAK